MINPATIPEVRASSVDGYEQKKPINEGLLKTDEKMNISPRIEIIEQPQSPMRFRYKSECRNAGRLLGASSIADKQTWPTIRMVGHTGPFVIFVSCVTTNEPHYPHPYNLVKRDDANGRDTGFCLAEVYDRSREVVFAGIGIQCVTKNDIRSSLENRRSLKMDPFRTFFDLLRGTTEVLYHGLEIRLYSKSHFLPWKGFLQNSIHVFSGFKYKFNNDELSSLRLCFLARDPQRDYCRIGDPVVSVPIYKEGKTPDLAIRKVIPSKALANKSEPVVILCEPICRDDTNVWFYKLDENNKIEWFDKGTFIPADDVHKNVAIYLKTPLYLQPIEEGCVAKVRVSLERKSDGVCSNPVEFTFVRAVSDVSTLTTTNIPHQQGIVAEEGQCNLENIFSSQFPDPVKIAKNVNQMSIDEHLY